MSVTQLTQFIRASDNVVKFIVGFKLIKAESHTVFNLRVWNTELQDLWKKVKDNYDNYLDHLISTEGVYSEDISSADAKYQSTYKSFVDCMSEINEKLQQLKSIKSPNSTPAAIVMSTPQNSPSLPNSHGLTQLVTVRICQICQVLRSRTPQAYRFLIGVCHPLLPIPCIISTYHRVR